jgi:hypothetical protein
MEAETQWQVYPRSKSLTPALKAIVDAFTANESRFEVNLKQGKSKSNLESNEVLKFIEADLVKAGFKVESSRRDKIKRPVLYGRQGKSEKSFDVDGFHESEGIILEVESGRGFTNNQFLKDFFSGCAMQGVRHIAIALDLSMARHSMRILKLRAHTLTPFMPQAECNSPSRAFLSLAILWSAILTRKTDSLLS